MKELSRAELEARLSAVFAEDHIEDDEASTDYATLASIETVSTPLARKLPPAVPRPENQWL